MFCNQLRLTLRKNLILKKRNCCSTVWELLVPLIGLAILVIIRVAAPPKDVSAGDFTNLNDGKSALLSLDRSPSELLYRIVCGGDAGGAQGMNPYAAIGFVGAPAVLSHLKTTMLAAANNMNLPWAPNSHTVTCCLSTVGGTCNGFTGVEVDAVDYVNNQLFMQFDSEAAMQAYTQSDDYAMDSVHRPLLIGISILGSDSTNKQWYYKIRLNRTETPNQGLTRFQINQFVTGYDRFQFGKPYDSGLMLIMSLLDQYIVETDSAGSGVPGTLTTVNVAPMPIPAYEKDNFKDQVGVAFGLFLICTFMWPFSRFVRNVVEEKERRIKEGMRMMGLLNSVFWASWMLTYALLFFIYIVLALVMTKPTIFKHSDASLVFVMFALFAADLIAMGALVSTIFSRAKSAGTLSPLLLFAMYVVYFGVDKTNIDPSAKTAACLSAPACFSLAAEHVLTYEAGFIGSQWSNINEETNSMTLATALGMMFFDMFLYSLIAWYLEHVMPSEFGTHLKPWFLFTSSYWEGVFSDSSKEQSQAPQVTGDGYRPMLDEPLLPDATELKTIDTDEESKVDDNAFIEPIPEALQGREWVKIRKLRKEFGSGDQAHVAVNSLNLELFEGQIFVLLGHNGAGKTTTINMLTGLLPPSKGTAKVLGNDINTDMSLIRQCTGVCPQHDILFPMLSVEEHLKLFAEIKGVPRDEVDEAVRQAIFEVQLEREAYQFAGSLSGGQKRRLSLAIALIGDSKVVFLDEPTSGVDPFSRRAIWDLLQMKKNDRVIILTTHFLDEADQLGDRIAIMHRGQLKCVGSPLFLKRKYGVGYNMVTTFTQKSKENTEQLKNLVLSHVPSCKVLSDAGNELSFQLPLECTPQFAELLQNMEDQKEQFHIANYGLSVTTLEEVFLKVAEEQETLEQREETKQLVRRMSERMSVAEPLKDSYFLNADTAHRGWLRDFRAMITKRWHIQKRDKKALWWQMIGPLLLLLIGFAVFRIPPNFHYQNLRFNVKEMYGSDDQVYYNQMAQSTQVMDTIKDRCVPVPAMAQTKLNLSDVLFANRADPGERYGALFWEPLTTATTSLTVFSNVSAFYGMPGFYHLAANGWYRYKTSVNSANIVTDFQPFDFTKQERAAIEAVNGIGAAIVIALAFTFIPASVVSFVVKEKEIKAKHLQRIAGVRMSAYWSANYVWDFMQYFLVICLASIIVLGFNNDNLVGSNFPTVFLVFVGYGLSVISFTYMCSFVFGSHSTAQNVMVMVYLIGGIVLLLVSFILYAIPSTSDFNRKYLRHLFRLMPNFCLADAIFWMSIRNLPQVKLGQWDLDVTGLDLIYLFVESVVYFVVVLVIEYGSSFPIFAGLVKKDPHLPVMDGEIDEDVNAEKQRILSGAAANEVITLRGLHKTYPPAKVAVKDLFFSIPAGECFGFLGVNGAGKSTTLKILTGDIAPTRGQALLGGFDIENEPEEVRRLIGYCPQFDALHEHLSAEETLELYGRVRGVPEDRLADMVDYLIERLTLRPHAKRPAGTYSGGNKRKLSVAIALIGNPRVCFLDEPSTGMDPVSRRFMWDFISETMSDRAVVLTTHSMEECEALCQRIGILVMGDLKCLGTSQHLKNRFGQGFQMEVCTPRKDTKPINDFIRRTFIGSECVEVYGGNMKFHVPPQDMNLAQMFALVEQNKEELNITEYSIGQTSLEQIFIQFAKQGQPGQRAEDILPQPAAHQLHGQLMAQQPILQPQA